MQTFERETFTTNRAMEFFTEKELQMRIGCSKDLWSVALLKELIDNSLDACENAGIQPEISVTVEPDSLSVLDNGPGLPITTLEKSLDYMVRVSNKSHYVSPTRGQMGNALKCLWAAPFVVDGKYGHVEVCTGGVNHHIEVTLDRIAQEPRLKPTSEDGFVKKGAFFKIHWPGIASYPDHPILSSFYKLVLNFGLFNPHATFTLNLPKKEPIGFHATTPDWKKWLTNSSTSPHWYTVERLRSLIAAYLTEEEKGSPARTVRDFVSKFNGLKGSPKQKAVTELARLSGAYLHDLVAKDDVQPKMVRLLLDAMKSESKSINPKDLGVIGEEHVTKWLDESCECNWYSKAEKVTSDGLPYVLEVAFGVQEDYESRRIIVAGLNWSPVLKIPIHQLHGLLSQFRVDAFDPVILVVHLACPRLEFTEQGKGAVSLPNDVLIQMEKLLKSVTKKWSELKRRADRENRVSEREIQRLGKQNQKITYKKAVYQSMVEAYMKASAGNTLPANARQIMYAVRPLVLTLRNGDCWKDSSYFTQHLLPDFIEENPELTADWNVVFDARGRLMEPHTQRRIDLGTLEVQDYLRDWSENISKEINLEIDHTCPTKGPHNRYAYALFIEKEGFYPLLQRADIARRYDIAIMSTKGMSVTAARKLVEKLSGQGVVILVLHDFDKSGFNIVNSLKSNTRRFKFRTQPNVIDLGLRLADVENLHLESEYVGYGNNSDPKDNLRDSGATQSECDFLVREKTSTQWVGERVELNAMPSDVFIQWLETKLKEVGVSKVVPTLETLEAAYCRAYESVIVESVIAPFKNIEIGGSSPERLNQSIKASIAVLKNIDSNVTIPDNLEKLIRESIEGTHLPWDLAIWELVKSSRRSGN